MADWPTVTDDDGTGKTGTIYCKALTDLIKAYIQAGSHQSGLDADKPETSSPGDVYFATDTDIIYKCILADTWSKIANVNNLESGVDGDKSESPAVGDVYIATETEKLYVCFVAGTWSEVGGGDGEAEPNMLRLPDPASGGWVTPAAEKDASSNLKETLYDQQSVGSGWQLYSGSSVRAGQRLELTGKTLGNARLWLKRVGTFGNPGEYLYVRVRKVLDDSIIETSSLLLVPKDDITTEWAPYDFPLTCAPDEEVRITVECDLGWDADHCVLVGEDMYKYKDGQFTYYISSWAEMSTDDLAMVLKTAGIENATIDDDLATYWVPDPANEAGAWFTWDLGSLKYIEGCRFYWGAEVAYRPTEYKIYISPDNSEWTEVIHETEAAPASAWMEYKWAGKRTQYIKFVVTTHGATGTKIFEIDGYDPQMGDFVTPTVEGKSSDGGGGLFLDQPEWSGTGQMYNGNWIRHAQKITLTDKTLTKVKFLMKKEGAPTGTVYARVRKVSDDSIIETSTTELDAADITTELAWYEFALTCSVNEAVRVSVEYSGGDESNGLLVCYQSTDVCDGSYSYYKTDWIEQATWDLTFKLYVKGISAANTIDEDERTYWLPDPENEAGAWISWDIGSLKYIGTCRIYWGSEAAYRPTEYKIYASPDNSEWTEVIHEEEAAPASAWKEYKWYARYARYLKLVVVTHGLSGTKVYEADEYSKTTEEALACHGHGGL